ncbi:MAG TPA: aminoacyl-tRNA hydrolase [Rhodobacteraceae bacterium]|jgi:ribosome-associated protein|nr:alternative ribosome rescue aminoacyl-tRNA hydrolase ArfB [Amylibacter sp.]MDG1997936.1 alternative ribosome rescue aminoacyl-tRNA hydrolase ArfB [Amylibacter sp.]HAD27799.1 aminoacyl-tRNA hydrolase [Paracoccaceae bacterium]|tara:strand:+ start:1772 stop:2188 length:417 start_codon:yes stop_codon:yes gene_type:complete
MRINDSILIEDWELTESFTRSSGPGGQHVNKTSSAVELRFEAARSPNLTPAIKSRLKRLAGRRWTKDGAVVVTAEAHRSQLMNRELAQKKLIVLVREALKVPKRRVQTKPTLGSKRRRLDGKTRRGEVKKLRGKVDGD